MRVVARGCCCRGIDVDVQIVERRRPTSARPGVVNEPRSVSARERFGDVLNTWRSCRADDGVGTAWCACVSCAPSAVAPLRSSAAVNLFDRKVRGAGLHGGIRYPTLSQHATSAERGNERARRSSTRDARRGLAHRGRADARHRRRLAAAARARRWRNGATTCARASIICGARWCASRAGTTRSSAHCSPRRSSRASAAGIVFFNNGTYLGMCGHGLIGVVRTLEYLGRLDAGPPPLRHAGRAR